MRAPTTPMPVSSSDGDSLTELVAHAAAGDERAFARIVRLHHAGLVRATFVATGDEDLADAAARAAWTVAWRRLGSLRDAEELPRWVASIAGHEAEAAAGRRARRSGTARPDAPPSAEELRVRAERAATMRVAPIDADEVAHAARAEAEGERGRRISVAVSAIVGALVAAAPWILPALHR